MDVVHRWVLARQNEYRLWPFDAAQDLYFVQKHFHVRAFFVEVGVVFGLDAVFRDWLGLLAEGDCYSEEEKQKEQRFFHMKDDHNPGVRLASAVSRPNSVISASTRFLVSMIHWFSILYSNACLRLF